MQENSRYRYCTVMDWGDIGGTSGVKLLDEREPFLFRDEADNVYYTARAGDTWWGLAWKFFRSFRNPSLMWFLLCEFQPEPVVDPTIAITGNQQVVIPAERIVRNYAFSRERRRYHH